MIELGLLSLAFAGATWVGGWWTVPLVAAVWALLRQGVPWRAGVAAAVAWGGLLGLTIPWPALLRLAQGLGGIIVLPAWAALFLPPLFALLLAWSAARVASALRGVRQTTA